jgi:hypothetical protein
VGSNPVDDDRDIALAVTSDDSSSDNEDDAGEDADGAGAGPGSVVLSGQASPSARMLTNGPRQLSEEEPAPSAGELVVQDTEGATLGMSEQGCPTPCARCKKQRNHRDLFVCAVRWRTVCSVTSAQRRAGFRDAEARPTDDYVKPTAP